MCVLNFGLKHILVYLMDAINILVEFGVSIGLWYFKINKVLLWKPVVILQIRHFVNF